MPERQRSFGSVALAGALRSSYVGPVDLDTPAIVVAVLPHGEHGAVVRFLTPADGVVAGYVPGGRSRTLRPVLQPGNGVALRLRARTAGALPGATVELVRARTALATGRATAAGLVWLTALTATVIDEGTAVPRLYAALDGVLDAMGFAVAAEPWLAGMVRYELLLLAELGFGIDLASCAATGAAAADADLAFVSPRSSHAVGRIAGTPFAAKLLPLPAFLVGGGAPLFGEIVAGMRTTGFFLDRDVLVGRAAALAPGRARLGAIVTGLFDQSVGDLAQAKDGHPASF